jgi:hypothetical protein
MVNPDVLEKKASRVKPSIGVKDALHKNVS